MRRLYPCRCNNEEGASISFAATTEQHLCCLFVCLLVTRLFSILEQKRSGFFCSKRGKMHETMSYAAACRKSQKRRDADKKDKVRCCKSAPSTVTAAADTGVDDTSPYYLLHKCFSLFHSNDTDPPRPLIRRYHPTGAFFPSGKKDFPTDQIF